MKGIAYGDKVTKWLETSLTKLGKTLCLVHHFLFYVHDSVNSNSTHQSFEMESKDLSLDSCLL